MRYEIKVKGHLHQRWSPWLYDFDMTQLPDGTTVLTGEMPDDAAVYGLLTRFRDMGLILVSVNIVDSSAYPSV